MTEIQFNEIKERLTDWRNERGLTYENQQEGFLGNVFEELSEYFRAKDDFSKAFEKLKEFKINQDLELEKAVKELN
ncbi:hypothetical protein KXJ91_001403 [Campylobacter coli]|nr:hypothetical protein [Campylobacter coli]